MRSIEEQMKEIKRRRKVYESMNALRRKIIADVAVCGASVIMIIGSFCFLPEIREVSELAPVRQYGSLILELPNSGYVLISLLSFVFGVAFTLLCQHFKQQKEKEREIE